MAGRRSPSLLRLASLAAALSLVATLLAMAESESVESSEAVEKDKKKAKETDEDDSLIGYYFDPWFCWFGWPKWSGKPCEKPKKKKEVRKKTPEGKPIHDEFGCEGEQIDGYLDKFCGEDFEGKVFYCPCCADHLLGDIPRRASLLVPGKATEVPAWQRNEAGKECRVGYLRTYTLGDDRTPTAWCDRGRLVCECSDFHAEWHEEETSCTKGGACQPPSVPEELHFMTQGELVNGDRVRSVQEIEYKMNAGDTNEDGHREQEFVDRETELYNETGEIIPCPQVIAGTGIKIGPGAAGEVVESQHGIVVEWDDYPQLGPAVVYRPQVAKSPQEDDGNPEGLPFCLAGLGGHERIAIGYTTCDYYTIDQCHLYYSKYLDGTWNFCELDTHHVRMCGTVPVTLAEAEGSAKNWLRWAIEWSWRPHLEWDFTFDESRLIVKPTYEPQPSKEVSEDVQYILRQEGHESADAEDAAQRHKRHEHRHKYHQHHHKRKHQDRNSHNRKEKDKKAHHSSKPAESEGGTEEE